MKSSRRNVNTTAAFCFGILFSLFIAVIPAAAQNAAADALALGVPVTGRTVILGTWTWDIESNKQGRSEQIDVWWQQKDRVNQSLTPRNQAGLALILSKDYEYVTAGDLAETTFSKDEIENSLLAPGTVLALRTNEGNLAKIRIIGYRASHDFSFDDAKYTDDCRKSFLLRRPNNPQYHLEIEWTLYPAAQPEL